MENASKALLIAASVLIVILLIAFEMRIFNSTSGTSDQLEGTMNITEIATFNSKFTAYIGTNKSRAQIVSLLNTIISSNATSTHQVYVNSGSAKDKINSLGDTKYSVEIDSDTGYTGGYVSDITIKTSSGTTI